MITIERLNGLQREEIALHLQHLSLEDLALRFGHYLSEDKLKEYAEKINFNRDIVLGAYNAKRELIGFCHSVGYLDKGLPMADVGISVLNSERGSGIGLRLLQASFDIASQRGIVKINVYTLKRNRPMFHLMKKLGGEIFIEDDEVTMSFDLRTVDDSEKMEHFISSNGIEYIRKIVNPNEKTILFVHGAGGDAWQWRTYFMPYFAKLGVNSVAISLPNHGQSKKDDAYELTDYIDIIKEAHEYAGDNVVLIGHSMGGFLLQKYVADHHIENKLILLASMPPFNPATLSGSFISLVQDHLKDNQARTHLENLLSQADSVDTENIEGEVVLFAGKSDDVIPLKWKQKVSHHYRAKLYTVEGGHNLMLGKGWKNVADLLAQEVIES